MEASPESSPYTAPRGPLTPPTAGGLAPYQRRVLRGQLASRDRPPTLLGLVVPMLPRLGLLILLAAVNFSVSLEVGLFTAGLAAGAVLRQVSLLYTALQHATILREVVDWDKVERLLADDAPPREGVVPADSAGSSQ